MLSQLNFSEIATMIYHTPLVYIIFYYLVVFLVASIVKAIINININEINTSLGMFKVDEKLIPVLLLIAWFSLIMEFVGLFATKIYVPQNSLMVPFFCILISILLLFVLRGTQKFAQKKILIFERRKKGLDYRKEKEKTKKYITDTDFQYKFITVSILLTFFCFIFSYIRFGVLISLMILGLMITYWLLVVIPIINQIIEQLKSNWHHW